jgi:hypothetical protein
MKACQLTRTEIQKKKKYLTIVYTVKLGYNEHKIIVFWLDPTYLRLLISWLLRTHLLTNKFGPPQAVRCIRVSLYINFSQHFLKHKNKIQTSNSEKIDVFVSKYRCSKKHIFIKKYRKRYFFYIIRFHGM